MSDETDRLQAVVAEMAAETFMPPVFMRGIIEQMSKPTTIECVFQREVTDEQREQWQREAESRRAEEQKRQQEYLSNLDRLEGVLRDVAELHKPTFEEGRWGPNPYCAGCDIAGMEAEEPEWPCATARTIMGWSL